MGWKRSEPYHAQRSDVTQVTGFLGAGKTTLVNYILNENHGKKVGDLGFISPSPPPPSLTFPPCSRTLIAMPGSGPDLTGPTGTDRGDRE